MPVGAAVRDLAALHDPQDWSHVSPAPLQVEPDDWLSGSRSPLRVLGSSPEMFDIEDHRALEQAILDQLAALSALEYPLALEATAWLTITLLADEFPESRIQAAALLSQWSGTWIETADAGPLAPGDEAALAAAIRAFEEAVTDTEAADQRERVVIAVHELARVAPADAWTGARLLSGVGRHLAAFDAPWPSETSLAALGTHIALLALEAGTADADPEVAEACRQRLELLSQHLGPQP